MKKLYVALLAAMASTMVANAQLSLSTSSEAGKDVIENGATVKFGDVQEEEGEYFLYPSIYLHSTATLNNVSVTVKSDIDLQICGFGSCMIRKEFSFSNVAVAPAKPVDFQLETLPYETVDEIPESTTLIEVSNPLSPSSKRSFTLVMGPKVTSVTEIDADADNVAVTTSALVYNLRGEGRLQVFSILGQPVLDRNVSGSGVVDITSLPKGIYIYDLSGNSKVSGKFMRR